MICSETHELINSIWNKEELPEERKELIIVPIYMKGDTTDCSNYRDICLSTTENFIQHLAIEVNSICRSNFWGYQCGF